MAADSKKKFYYGGQAVIEGVMIRGKRCASLAVRRPDGTIAASDLPLSQIYTGRLRLWPFMRGVIVLIETIALGIKALNRSAMEAAGEKEKEEKTARWAIGVTTALALVVGIGLFFLVPLFAVRSLDSFVASDTLSNFLEGVLRLVILLGYIVAIGFAADIKRVFAYHGAEHMTVHAYEHGDPLTVEEVSKYDTAHPRCGTAFLLVVAVVAVVVFAFLGRPVLWLTVLSRVALLPVIAAISYEVIRFSGAHSRSLLARVVSSPGMALQTLTTRRPDALQVEVAIAAMKRALEGDANGEQTQTGSPDKKVPQA